ncbi:hypothetical protein BX265_6754 [Streptomyces sp. TLI_235]|nr:hypothetical protein [Streptomyces sp. TLI_235]PBC72136.1 hypothetical protein BX265_6754 [Streptomyces sp. TLI_235]
MDIEDDLSRLLGAGAEHIHVPVQTIVAEAATRGRRLRRRRRITQALGAVAAVALLTGGVAAFGPDGAPHGQAPAGPVASSTALGVLGPTDPPVNGKVATTPAGMLGIFAALLPDSARLSAYSGGGSSTGGGLLMARADMDLGDHVPVTVDITLVRATVPTDGDCPNTESFGGLPRERCSRTPEGYRLATEPIQGGGQRYLLQRPDGITVELLLHDGVVSGEGSTMKFTRTREEPPKTADFWKQVVRSPLWDTRVAVDIARDGANRAAAAQR